MPLRRRFLPPLVIFLAFVGAADAADQQTIGELLKREIIGSTLPLAEMQRYCEARVPRMKPFATTAEWEAEAGRLRAAVLEKVVYRGEAARWRDAPTKVQWLQTIPGGPGYRIKKLRYEALPGMWIPALLYEPEKLAGKVPVVMNVHGHSGSIGKAELPQQIRCINQAKRGILAMNVDWLGMGQLSSAGFGHLQMNQLDLCGTSGLAPFYLSLKRGLDVLLALEHADPGRVAVTGLSGGGWQTIVISALDTRVKLSAPVAGYSSFRNRAVQPADMGDSEQMPNDLGTVADYTHLTALRAPRPTLLIYNSKDNCCFVASEALPPLIAAVRPFFRLYGQEDALRWHVNDVPGTHNYEIDNRQAFYRALGDFFYPGDKAFDAKEIPCPGETKTREQLLVDLPARNEDFNSLALALAKNLPREPELPKDKPSALMWQEAKRAALREIVKAKDFEVVPIKFASQQRADLKVTSWKFQIGGAWTVPAVELVEGTPGQTAVLIADSGRAAAAADAAGLLAAGYRVIVADPLNLGESSLQQGWLFCLFLAAVGDRPLGLQASQVAAIARWAAAEYHAPVAVAGVGQRCCVAALVAADLEPKAIAQVQLHRSLGSLKELIEQNVAFNAGGGQELFCFGLLESLDIKHLAALAAPRPVIFQGAGDRTKSETADLAAWRRLFGSG
jgi:dienelactone hydrolase